MIEQLSPEAGHRANAIKPVSGGQRHRAGKHGDTRCVNLSAAATAALPDSIGNRARASDAVAAARAVAASETVADPAIAASAAGR